MRWNYADQSRLPAGGSAPSFLLRPLRTPGRHGIRRHSGGSRAALRYRPCPPHSSGRRGRRHAARGGRRSLDQRGGPGHFPTVKGGKADLLYRYRHPCGRKGFAGASDFPPGRTGKSHGFFSGTAAAGHSAHLPGPPAGVLRSLFGRRLRHRGHAAGGAHLHLPHHPPQRPVSGGAAHPGGSALHGPDAPPHHHDPPGAAGHLDGKRQPLPARRNGAWRGAQRKGIRQLCGACSQSLRSCRQPGGPLSRRRGLRVHQEHPPGTDEDQAPCDPAPAPSGRTGAVPLPDHRRRPLPVGLLPCQLSAPCGGDRFYSGRPLVFSQ